MRTDQENEIRDCLGQLQSLCHQCSKDHGFYDSPNQNVAEKLMLIVSELAEAMETHRKDINRPDDHLPHLRNFDVELADAIIRIMDLAEWQKVDLARAITEKYKYNLSRPYKHGKKY